MTDPIAEWKRKKDGVKKKNKKFIQKLKQHQTKRFDQYADSLHERVFKKVDCLDCANCCTSIPPIVTKTDAVRIAKHLQMSEKAFEEAYLTVDEDGDTVMNTTPCTFLQADNTCLIYEYRPKACREYPHTDQLTFTKNLHLHATNALYCPAVYHILEEMKKNVPV